MIGHLKRAWLKVWCSLVEADYRTITMWIAVVAMVMSFVGLYRAQEAAASSRDALHEVTLDNRRQEWTITRDQAEQCLREWSRYEDVQRIYVDIPEALIAFGSQQSPTPPTDAQLDAFRAAFAATFAQYPPPSCDRESAQDQLREANERINELNQEN